MIIVPVKIGRPIQGYSSPLEAIEAAKRDPRQQMARADGMLLAGRSFVGGRASYSRWCLEFTGSLWVDVFSRDDEVEWQLAHERPVFEEVSTPYALRWPTGSESVIDPARLIGTRVGAPFWQFWASEEGLYVYLRRKLILCFHSVRHAQDGTCILSVFEDD